ncbi:SDR family oxidoreductase [bacterium]|nr:SDR family oxidoreductase [bacterium]
MEILITGASGKLGMYLLREGPDQLVGCSRNPPLQSFGRSVERLDPSDLDRLEPLNPQVIIHTAALSAVADCHQNPDLADQVNHLLTARLAHWCHANGRRFIYVSTDMVFDGESAPYREDANPCPLSEYGRSKWRGEKAALAFDSTLVARIALMVGPALGTGRAHYDQLVEQLRAGQSLSLFQDEWRGMISYQDAAQALLQLCRQPVTGIVHLAGPRLSRLELGQQIAAKLGVPSLVTAGWRSDYPAPEPRARDLTLADTRLHAILPDWSPRSIASQLDAWLT